jgi:hypothetical protein
MGPLRGQRPLALRHGGADGVRGAVIASSVGPP